MSVDRKFIGAFGVLLTLAASAVAQPTSPAMLPVRPKDRAVAPFRLAVYETTWQQYLEAVREAGCPMPANGWEEPIEAPTGNLMDHYPVTGVTGDGVECYIRWVNQTTGRQFRLPSPEEWLVAAESAPETPLNWTTAEERSADRTPQIAADPRKAVKARVVRPVGRGQPTPDGIYDLEGNASEQTSMMRPGFPPLCERYGQEFCREYLILGMGSINRPLEYRERLWIVSGIPYYTAGFRLAMDM